MTRERTVTSQQDLNTLPSHELAPLLMKMPPRERLDAVLRCRDPEAALAAVPVEDFFFTVMEIGPDDALPLLAHARLEQLSFVFDLEWWDKASLSPAKSLQWLERLEAASRNKLLEWLHQADFELLVSLFKKWIRVSLIQEDLDPLEAKDSLPPNTLDDQYYWGVHYPQYEALIGRILLLLFEVSQGFYRELLNHVIWGLEADLEEDAYRFHKGRLEDSAIPEFYDALAIYSARKPGGRGIKGSFLHAERETAAPSFALSLVGEGDFLHRVLQQVESAPLLDALRLELASLANQIIVADQLAPDNAELLHFAVQKAAAWAGLGLEMVSKGEVADAVGLLEEVYLEDLFRLGYGEVAGARKLLDRVVKSGWIARWPAGLSILDEPWRESAEQLLEKTPRLALPAGRMPQHPAEGLIRTRADIDRAKQVVSAISGGGVLFEMLGVDASAASQWRLWQLGQITQVDEITLGSLIYTAAAQAVESGEWIPVPMELDGWLSRYRRFDPRSMERAIRFRVADAVKSAAQRGVALAYLDPLLRAYADELGPFLGETPPDPKLLRFFLFAGS